MQIITIVAMKVTHIVITTQRYVGCEDKGVLGTISCKACDMIHAGAGCVPVVTVSGSVCVSPAPSGWVMVPPTGTAWKYCRPAPASVSLL